MKFDKRKMISILKRVGFYSLITISGICSVMMVICAYCGMLPPQDYPRLSLLPLAFPFFLLLTIIFAIVLLFVKKKWAIMPAVALILCISDIRAYFPLNFSSEAPDDAIKVMSFNIGGVSKDEKAELLDYLEEANPDICCFQEYDKHWDTESLQRLDQMFPFSYIDTLNSSRCHVACFSKYEIIPGSEISPFGNTNGNAAVALDIIVRSDTLMLVNNHLQSYHLSDIYLNEYKDITAKSTSMEKRKQNTKNILSKISNGNIQRGPQVDAVYDYLDKNMRKYTVACGDLNEPTMGYAHYMLTRLLKDAYTRSGNGFGFSYSRNKINYRIDHILCSSDITPYEAEVDKSCQLSDHFPIICYLKLD